MCISRRGFYLSEHPSFKTEFESCFSPVLHVRYVSPCNEKTCFCQNTITFRRLKVFNLHASDEQRPQGDELETDAVCGMGYIYNGAFISHQQTPLFICPVSEEEMTKPGYEYFILCNKVNPPHLYSKDYFQAPAKLISSLKVQRRSP